MRTLLRLLALLFTAALCAFALTAPAYAADGANATGNKALLDTASWALLAGVLTPLLTSLAQQPRWTGSTRTVVGVLISVVIGVVTLLANGSLNDGAQTVLSVIALVVVTSAAAYKTIWQPMGVAPKIENATSKTPPSAPDPSGRPAYTDPSS